MVYGTLRVTLQKVTSHGDCVLRKMEVVEGNPKPKMASQPLMVTQVQLTSWAAPFLSCPIYHRPHDEGPKKLLQKACSSHVQVRESSVHEHIHILCAHGFKLAISYSDGVGRRNIPVYPLSVGACEDRGCG